MAGINKAILIGNLGKDPEVRYMNDGTPVANFNIATNENWTDKQTGEKKSRTEWHRIVAWGRLGEICGQYLSKGSQVYVEGRLQTRSWEQDGVTKYTTEIIALAVQFLGGRGDSDYQAGYQGGNYQGGGGQSGGYQRGGYQGGGNQGDGYQGGGYQGGGYQSGGYQGGGYQGGPDQGGYPPSGPGPRQNQGGYQQSGPPPQGQGQFQGGHTHDESAGGSQSRDKDSSDKSDKDDGSSSQQTPDDDIPF